MGGAEAGSQEMRVKRHVRQRIERCLGPSPRNPETSAEWQAAVTGAYHCLQLDSARQYGLVEGGPEINVERCEQLLEEGKRRGVLPDRSKIALLRFLREVC
jgi:hypothetical protein